MRYIDDLLAVALFGGQDCLTPTEWTNFKSDMNNFGILTWDVEEPSRTVDYLDISIKMQNGSFVTKTYQKPINLYQYIPPGSAHPLGMMEGVVHGILTQYYYQNSRQEDFWKISMQFYRHLKARGWERATLEQFFVDAYNEICNQPKCSVMSKT